MLNNELWQAPTGGLPAWAGIEAVARFDASDSSEMVRDQVNATTQDKWTLSWWFKRASTGQAYMFCGRKKANQTNADYIFFHSPSNNNDLRWEAQDYNGDLGSDNSNTSYSVYTQSGWTSTSTWYHAVLQYDSTQSTSTDRVKWYIDGSQQSVNTRYSGYPAQNRTPPMNAGVVSSTPYEIQIGHVYGNVHYDGRLAEIIFIDGTIYAPTQFAHTVSSTWTAKNPDVDNLNWGDNGHYLRFLEDGNLGKDYSGNGNDFTVSNMGTDHQETSNLPPTDSS